MYKELVNRYSQSLEREMRVMLYGREGMPLLCFPTQDSMCRNHEDFGMIDRLSDFINDGRVQLFVVDTVDRESWSLETGENSLRSARQERYFHYIVDEVVPLIHERSGRMPAVTGFSMGANHAAIVFLRRPDLFQGVIALSGIYDSASFSTAGWTRRATKTPPNASCRICPPTTLTSSFTTGAGSFSAAGRARGRRRACRRCASAEVAMLTAQAPRSRGKTASTWRSIPYRRRTG